MTPAQIPQNRRMVARLRADPGIQAMIARSTFVAAAAVTLVLDLNSRAQDYRHRVAFQWCDARATGRWRRRVVERRGHAVLDRVIFEFEVQSDADACNDWLAARGW